jgi:L-galactonate dehydratase
MKQLAEYKPWFIEEPTSPDDILGHATIRQALAPYGIGVATGEQCQNRVIWKQLFQSDAIDIAQIDACRMGGVNEVLSVLLMANKLASLVYVADIRYGVPVVPHSGGVGLPEYTQHLSTIDYVLISKKLSLLEYVDHLHRTSYHYLCLPSEHFRYPSRVEHGYYRTPLEPGYSVEILDSAISKFDFPHGSFWASDAHAKALIYRMANDV